MTSRSLTTKALEQAAACAPLMLLWAAFCFFLWMFLASKGLEETASAGYVTGADGIGSVATVQRYCADWRHGMAGGWPLYVPGFFAVALAIAAWIPSRADRRLLIQVGLTLLGALLTAKLLAPVGARWLVLEFERDTGLVVQGSPLDAGWSIALPGILTVLSWTALLIALQFSLARRTIRPLIVPLVCYAVLASVRPGALGDLARPWTRELLGGDGVAILSTALIPFIAGVLWWRNRNVVPVRRPRHALETHDANRT